MKENESINGWTFEETVKTAENLMEAESNMLKWDVLRHLRDFLENYKDELEQYRAIGTIEEFKALKEKATPKKLEIEKFWGYDDLMCPNCKSYKIRNPKYCCDCGQALDWQ